MNGDGAAPRAHPLDDTHRRLEAVLRNASVAIFLMDDRQHCVFMNHAAEQLTGWRLSEVRALDRPLHDIIHHSYPDGSAFPLAECEIDRAFPEHNQTQGEEVFVHRDGHFYPVAFTASPIRDEASQTIGTIVEVRNISDEKAAAERQRLLVNELNHRVKNTLATVQSVAWQTFKGADPESLDRFMGRLEALSGAHNILTESSWHKAAMRNVVESAVDPFGAGRFRIDGIDCDIHPKAAITLAMVLHELATNAVKYGALSVPAGQVEIAWHCEDGETLTTLELCWAERNGPPVVPPTRRGFGSRLIERQVRLEFGGAATLSFDPAGVVCRLTLAMPANPEPIRLEAAAP
jgi:PAS domain S-box-containing protein